MKLSRYVYALLAVSLLAIVPQAHGLDSTSEGNVIAAKSGVSVSLIEGVPEASQRFVAEMKMRLKSLLECEKVFRHRHNGHTDSCMR